MERTKGLLNANPLTRERAGREERSKRQRMHVNR